MKNLTWTDFTPFEPCYNPKGRYGPWQGTMVDLLKRQDIPIDDRLWAFCTGVQWDRDEREKNLRLFACACVRKTPLADGRVVWDLLTDERSRNAIIVAEKFANGESTKEELDAAWGAARGAARDVARNVASNAAWYARVAAWHAASVSASVAAWVVAGDVAGDDQIQIAIEFLTGPADTGT